jgi:iron(III) transport system ATP-binding protein
MTSSIATPTTTGTEARTRIQIVGLTKSYPAQGSVGAVTAVDRVKLEIEPGELFFLLGPSGCGKTTLLRMIAGFVEPTGGKIVFCRGTQTNDVTYLEPNRRNTGMVFQSYALWPHMTVAENVGFGLDVRKVSGKEREDRIRDALEVVQMGQYAVRKPVQLSGGQQQRVALARAIVIGPDVLLLDEPLSNLDAKLRLELRLEIRRVCKRLGMTAIYVTHDQKEALSMADRIAVMRAGRVVGVGTPRELYQAPKTRFVAEFLGETNLLAAKGGGAGSVETAAGVLRCDHAIPSGSFEVSIRPEAIVVGVGGPNSTPCHVTHSIFLGDTAQLVLRTVGGAELRASVMNPLQVPDVGSSVVVSIPPAAVVPVATDDGAN